MIAADFALIASKLRRLPPRERREASAALDRLRQQVKLLEDEERLFLHDTLATRRLPPRDCRAG